MLRSRTAIEPFDVHQLPWVRSAYQHFGKGRHPASLNFGDCFADVLCRIRDEPLLFKGNDFARTDVRCAAMLR